MQPENCSYSFFSL